MGGGGVNQGFQNNMNPKLRSEGSERTLGVKSRVGARRVKTEGTLRKPHSG